jgi:transcriptional regulator with XRE-family HTH domain
MTGKNATPYWGKILESHSGIFPEMGNNLRMLRQSRNWDEEKAADAFGLSVGGYRKIERGERALNDKRIDQATRIYNVPASAVLGDEVDVIDVQIPRLELIRRAFRPDLPDLLGIPAGDWGVYSRSATSVLPDVADKIRTATGLDYGFIRAGDLRNVGLEETKKLLAAALTAPPRSNGSTVSQPLSKLAWRQARSRAKSK